MNNTIELGIKLIDSAINSFKEGNTQIIEYSYGALKQTVLLLSGFNTELTSEQKEKVEKCKTLLKKFA